MRVENTAPVSHCSLARPGWQGLPRSEISEQGIVAREPGGVGGQHRILSLYHPHHPVVTNIIIIHYLLTISIVNHHQLALTTPIYHKFTSSTQDKASVVTFPYY